VTEGLELLVEALSEWSVPSSVGELSDQPDPAELTRVNCVASEATTLCNCLNLERETGRELATPTLARPDESTENNDIE
jgi:hypothetical protein